MAEINHFEYGWITPALSYALSVLGSVLGLVCAGRIRTATGAGQRAWWGLLAAWALGGTAIWAMHFMAMLGFAVGGTRIRYDVPLTAASTVIAVAAVGIGLAIVGTGRLTVLRLLGRRLLHRRRGGRHALHRHGRHAPQRLPRLRPAPGRRCPSSSPSWRPPWRSGSP